MVSKNHLDNTCLIVMRNRPTLKFCGMVFGDDHHTEATGRDDLNIVEPEEGALGLSVQPTYKPWQ